MALPCISSTPSSSMSCRSSGTAGISEVFCSTVIIVTYDEKGHPATKDDCKDGGWMDLVNADGEPFKNQGDCVSYTNGN